MIVKCRIIVVTEHGVVPGGNANSRVRATVPESRDEVPNYAA